MKAQTADIPQPRCFPEKSGISRNPKDWLLFPLTADKPPISRIRPQAAAMKVIRNAIDSLPECDNMAYCGEVPLHSAH
jgi:hypothetical protein